MTDTRVVNAPHTTEGASAGPPAAASDEDSARWLLSLCGDGHERQDAVARLHALLLRAARVEVHRRRNSLGHLSPADVDDLALQAADDAVVAVLAKLDTFEGRSRFTTWAYKFAIYEAAVRCRTRSWSGREVPLEPDQWRLLPDADLGPEQYAEQRELLQALTDGIRIVLTPHQRTVLVALAVTGVPIDVLAERLGTTRGALYKTLHDARRKLRGHLQDQGLTVLADSLMKEQR
jgi:RNA polymerase sigma-70 factor (ECF subfamily)